MSYDSYRVEYTILAKILKSIRLNFDSSIFTLDEHFSRVSKDFFGRQKQVTFVRRRRFFVSRAF